MADSQRLAGKIALVTGASRGIGRAVAKRFAAEGAHVIAVARTVGALEELDDEIRAETGESATLVPLDLRDGALIDQLGGALYKKFGKLDALVGNAAMLGAMTPLEHMDVKVWQQVMDVNATANWRLIRSMHALLAQSEAPRAMFVTSGVTQGSAPFWGPYAASKSALESLVGVYAAEQKASNIRVNLVDPGVVATMLRAQAFPGEDASTLPSPESVTDMFVALAEGDCTRHGDRVCAAA